MSEHHTTVGHPAPIPAYRDPYEPALLHWDGVFFCLLCFASWVLFFWLWAWNHKPGKTYKVRHETPERFSGKHWRN
jgi:hypothetical protein